jgi:hypothetical protein
MGKQPQRPVEATDLPRMDPPPAYDDVSSRSSSARSQAPLEPANTDTPQPPQPEQQYQSPETMRSTPSYDPDTFKCLRKEDVGGCMNVGASAGCMLTLPHELGRG